MHSLEERNIGCRLRTHGFQLTVIANALEVCKRTVQRWLKSNRMVSRPLNRSHLRKLNETQREQVADFFLNNNTSRLRDGIKFVANSFGIYVSLSTIQRVLHESQLTFKKPPLRTKRQTLYVKKSSCRHYLNMPTSLGLRWMRRLSFSITHVNMHGVKEESRP